MRLGTPEVDNQSAWTTFSGQLAFDEMLNQLVRANKKRGFSGPHTAGKGQSRMAVKTWEGGVVLIR